MVKHLVIVGGGFSGATLALKASKHVRVTLVDRRNAFYHTPAVTRAIVDDRVSEAIFIPYDKFLYPKGAVEGSSVIQGEVLTVSPTKVEIKDQEAITGFDYLAICTGCVQYAPFYQKGADWKDSSKELALIPSKIKDLKNIVVIGGGPVGCELAGEIKYAFPDKSVTVVHATSSLLDPPEEKGGLSDKLRVQLVSKFKEIGVEVIYNEYASFEGPFQSTFEKKTVTLSSGTKIEADAIFVCAGAKVDNSFLSAELKEKLNGAGRLKVNEFFQVEGYTNIFALGDISSVSEPKMAAFAFNHGTKTADNISKLIEEKELEAYTPSAPIMILSLGPTSSIGQLNNGWIIPQWVAVLFKAKDNFIANFWGRFNAADKMPKFSTGPKN